MLKYTIIKSRKQYNQYCDALEQLMHVEVKNKGVEDEIELLTFLIEKWDEQHQSFAHMDPITLLKGLMEEHGLRSGDLAIILGVSKGLVSDILNYKKGLSKEIIRALAAYFKVAQEGFNRPYKLTLPINSHLRNASVMNTTKVITATR